MKKQKDEYRRCASVVLLRPTSDGEHYQVLLVHKPRKKDAWQIPQGGAEEGESVEETAIRELLEETGVHAEVVGRSKTSYQYDFPKSYRRFRPDHICGQVIQFVFAEATPSVQVTVDENEIDSYKWVLSDELPKYLKRREYRKIVEQLVEEGEKLLRSNKS
tara:strand:- start:75 stop:557 length:483 start_codon:yes stop_codon:yes gene_type:complete